MQIMNQGSRKERSRTQILEAADSCFGNIGFAATSMAQIADKAGLTRKTVYNLFRSKDDIVEQLIERKEALAEPLYRAQIDAGEDALNMLNTILLDSAKWCIANPEIAPFALAPRKRPGPTPPDDRPSFQRIVRDTMVLGQVQGHIRSDEDVNFMSMILLGIYAQAMISVVSGQDFNPDDIKRMIRIVIEGVGTQ